MQNVYVVNENDDIMVVAPVSDETYAVLHTLWDANSKQPVDIQVLLTVLQDFEKKGRG